MPRQSPNETAITESDEMPDDDLHPVGADAERTFVRIVAEIGFQESPVIPELSVDDVQPLRCRHDEEIPIRA